MISLLRLCVIVFLGCVADALSTIAAILLNGPVAWLAGEQGTIRFFWPTEGYKSFISQGPTEFCFFFTLTFLALKLGMYLESEYGLRKFHYLGYFPVCLLLAVPFNNAYAILFLHW